MSGGKWAGAKIALKASDSLPKELQEHHHTTMIPVHPHHAQDLEEAQTSQRGGGVHLAHQSQMSIAVT